MMPSKSWFPSSLQNQAAWFQNFNTQFSGVGLSLGFVAADITRVSNDNQMVQFCADQTVVVENFAKAFRAYRDTLFTGDQSGPQPAYPPLPTETPSGPLNAGIFERLDDLVKRIRVAPNYTAEIGELLGITPSTTVRPAPEEMQPTLKATPLPGSVVQVKFVRANTIGVMIEMQIDNSGTWSSAGNYFSSPAELVIPQNPQNLPRAVQVRARFLEKNGPVGLYSQVDTVSTVPTI